MALWGERGASVELRVGATAAVELFGESPSRALVTCRPEAEQRLIRVAVRHGVPLRRLGQTGGAQLRIELRGEGATGAAEGRGSDIADPLEIDLASLHHAWSSGLPALFGED
jgi:hypothetical protein